MSYKAIWFRKSASQLQLLDQSVSFDMVRVIVSDRLPLAVKEMESKGLDLDDPALWWQPLSIDGVIKIENAQGKLFRVAIYLTSDDRTAEKVLETIASKKFRAIRTDLGIDQHWVVLTDTKKPHSDEEWMDLLYGQIDRSSGTSGCTLLEM